MLPKQLEFVQSGAKEVLYSGAFGAGKSRALCIKVVKAACIPGNLVGLCRKTRTSLTRTTLRTLLNPDAELPPVLPPGSYEHIKSESLIKLHGGGEIIYVGCDQPDTLGSLNLGSCAVDEATELDEDEYTMLLGRLRNQADPVRQLFGATNPGSPAHFLHKRFFVERSPDRHLIQTRSSDNVFLPPDYMRMLGGFTGSREQRYVRGLWVAFEGLVYGDVWDRAVHIRRRDEGWVSTMVGIDEGYTNPAVLLKWGVDADGRMHLVDEWYESKRLQAEVVEQAAGMKASAYVYDPSAAGLGEALRNAGMDARPADNDVQAGIASVMDRLRVQDDDRPRLTCEPHCENFIREMESYAWQPDKDKPKKEMDHAMDAARYSVMHLDAGYIRPTVGAGAGRVERGTVEETADDRFRRIMETESAWT